MTERYLPPTIANRLRLPMIAAPMLLVSGPDLVIAACRAGVIGSFPTKNCRTLDELDRWLARMQDETRDGAPFAPNLIVHKTNTRLADDVRLVEKYAPELVITSVGSPAPVLDALHAAGTLVFADVASMRHVERALQVGVDGLILLTAGAGGQTGWANPFAFVRAVRAVFDGPVVLAGGVADGVALRAAQVLGCDLAYMGTRFIASQESLAPAAYKEMLVASSMDDVVLSRALTGLETNLLRPSVLAAGLDLAAIGTLNAGADGVAGSAPAAKPRRWPAAEPRRWPAAEPRRWPAAEPRRWPAAEPRRWPAAEPRRWPAAEPRRWPAAEPRRWPAAEPRRWKDVWSAGHTVAQVHDVPSVAKLVDRIAEEYMVESR